MNLPDSFIHQSFRYVLGRRSYAVSDWCDWFAKNHKDIPATEMRIIRKELKEAFERDDDARESGRTYLDLGEDCDRESWMKVLDIMNEAIPFNPDDPFKWSTEEC